MLPAANGGWSATNVTLGMLIRIAFQLQDNQIVGGPKWLFEDRFDVLGTGTAPGARDGPAVREAADAARGSIQARHPHRDTRAADVRADDCAAQRRKLGPKLTPSKSRLPVGAAGGARGNPPGRFRTDVAGPDPEVRRHVGPGRLEPGHLTMEQLATNLSSIVGKMVVDKTGSCRASSTCSSSTRPSRAWADEAISRVGRRMAARRPASDGPSIFTALQEQLGLKLESTKGPVERARDRPRRAAEGELARQSDLIRPVSNRTGALMVKSVLAAAVLAGFTAAQSAADVEAAGVRGRVGQAEHVRRWPRPDDAAAGRPSQPRERPAAADDSQRVPAPGFSDRRRPRLDEHRALSTSSRRPRWRNPSQEELQLMLRSLLADQVQVRRAARHARDADVRAGPRARADGKLGAQLRKSDADLRRARDRAGRASAARSAPALRVHAGIRQPQGARLDDRGARVVAVHLRRPHRRRSDRARRRVTTSISTGRRIRFPGPPVAAISRSRSTA